MRAAIYTRHSSENEGEASLEDQERLCRQEADRLGSARSRGSTVTPQPRLRRLAVGNQIKAVPVCAELVSY